MGLFLEAATLAGTAAGLDCLPGLEAAAVVLVFVAALETGEALTAPLPGDTGLAGTGFLVGRAFEGAAFLTNADLEVTDFLTGAGLDGADFLTCAGLAGATFLTGASFVFALLAITFVVVFLFEVFTSCLLAV